MGARGVRGTCREDAQDGGDDLRERFDGRIGIEVDAGIRAAADAPKNFEIHRDRRDRTVRSLGGHRGRPFPDAIVATDHLNHDAFLHPTVAIARRAFNGNARRKALSRSPVS